MSRVVTTIDQIVVIIRSLRANGNDGPVLVSGKLHAGKSTCSEELAEALGYVGVPSTRFPYDGYHLGVNRTPPGVTVPILVDIGAVEYLKGVHELISKGVLWPPVYDSQAMKHVADKGDVPVYFNGGVLILDGAFMFMIEGLLEISSLNLYVERPEADRRACLERCYLRHRGLSEHVVAAKLKIDGKRNAPVIVDLARQHADLIYRPAPRGLLACNHK